VNSVIQQPKPADIFRISSAFKRGDARAAQELMRGGRGVLYVPDSSGQYMDAERFAKLLAGLLGQDK
jgi:hypothetical protein